MDVSEFDWDAENLQHIARHDVSREEVEQFFRNGYIVAQTEKRNSEERNYSLGQTDAGRLLTVVFTNRGTLIRVVTAYTMRKKRTEAISGGSAKICRGVRSKRRFRLSNRNARKWIGTIPIPK